MDNTISLNVTDIPRELTLLLQIINGDQGVFEVYENDKIHEIDWNLFLDLAMHHRLFPIIYSNLKIINKKWVPEHVIKTLSQQYKQNTFHMLHLSAEMEKLSQLLLENQIQLLILKGPVLASDLYGDLSLRTCGDLDVIIPIQDLDKVDLLLSKRGYMKDDYIQTILGDWKWRHHHITYFHTQKQIKLEIHWRLNPGPGKEPDFHELWDRKRISSLTSYPVYYLGREDLFLFLVSHGARHGWSRLRWLIDIDKIIKQKVDWYHLGKLLKKYQYHDVGGQALILASQLLNSKLPEGSKLLISGMRPKRLAQEAVFYFEQMVNLHTSPVPDTVAIYHKGYLFSIMSLKQKVSFVISALYPYPLDAVTLPLPKHFHFLYFPLRPMLSIWRRLKKQAPRRRIS
ncbi:MAG: nucleotidyltransferase family protein [Bacillus sp. (in: Bacteria)]|nr:nucleotidyltransferase family protein [Bacillus sp. (in: firmicutes)]